MRLSFVTIQDFFTSQKTKIFFQTDHITSQANKECLVRNSNN